MTRRLLAGFLAITLFVVVTLAVPLGVVFAGRERDRLSTEVERDARVVAAEVADTFERGATPGDPELMRIAAEYSSQTGGRVVLVDGNGQSVADSDDPTDQSRDFSTRPEIKSALAGKFSRGSRESSTLDATLFYAAVPVVHDRRVLGVVRASYPATAVEQRSRAVWVRLFGLAGIVLAFTGVLGWLVATTMSRPVRALGRAADELAAGQLGARVNDSVGPPEVRQVAKSFNAMGDRLQGLVEGQRAFLADASHQLRTPLTALRLRLESIEERQAPDDGPLDHDLEAAETEVDRLSALVDGLLEMARIDARPPSLVTVDLDAAIDERVAVWSPLADETEVHLVGVGGGDGVRVDVVEHGLEQILDNLIANALEVAPTGTEVVVRAEPSAARGTGWVTLSVTDSGRGMTAAESARAFERFWRAPQAPSGGSGLGLAIVRRLAEISGGTASIEHPDAGGLRVAVTLRRATATAQG